MIIRMLTELSKSIDINTDHFNKELESMKMAQLSKTR